MDHGTSLNAEAHSALMGCFNFLLNLSSLLSINKKIGVEVTVTARKSNHPWAPSLPALIPRLYTHVILVYELAHTFFFFLPKQVRAGTVCNHAYCEQ